MNCFTVFLRNKGLTEQKPQRRKWTASLFFFLRICFLVQWIEVTVSSRRLLIMYQIPYFNFLILPSQSLKFESEYL